MRDYYWINKPGVYKEDGKVFCQKKRIYWDMFFRERTKFVFQNYEVVKECITRLKPSEYRYKADLKPKCLTWRCKDFTNCPFVLNIVPFGKTTEKTDEELKKGSYWIRKAQDHDHSQETLSEPINCDRSMSKYYKIEKRYKTAEIRMGELEDQLKMTTVKTRRCRIQEKIRNLRKLIKKAKADMKKVKDSQDKTGNEVATHPYSKQI